MIASPRTFGLVLVASALAASACAGTDGAGRAKTAAVPPSQPQEPQGPADASRTSPSKEAASKRAEPPPKSADADEQRPKEPPLPA